MHLQRRNDGVDCTLGDLTRDDGTAFGATLELPWKDNAPDMSCIPAGDYTCQRRFSAKHGYEVFGLLNVPDRSDIEIHIGNFPKDSLGCILVGSGIGDDHASIIESRAAFARLMTMFKGVDVFPLTVSDAPAVAA